MSILLTMLIVAVDVDGSFDQRFPDADVQYECGFEKDLDLNHDQWPDEWTRRQGVGYPHYVGVAITPTDAPEGERVLRIDLDGGGAVVTSPRIAIDATLSYLFEGLQKTDGLEYDEAYFVVRFLDGEGNSTGEVVGPRVGGTQDWERVQLGPFAIPSAESEFAVIELRLEPTEKEDLTGAAEFDGIRLAMLPRMQLESSQPGNLFRRPDEVQFVCHLAGHDRHQVPLVLELFDLEGTLIDRKVEQISEVGPVALPLSNAGNAQAELVYKPPIKDFGFYRVRASMLGSNGPIQQTDVTLAVIHDAPQASGSKFGWSLPAEMPGLSYAQLQYLLRHSGVHWIKLPVWYSESESDELDRVVEFVERLKLADIETVGVLTNPPEDVRRRLGAEGALDAAEVFSAEPGIWYPSLETLLVRLAMRIRWWQLGTDDDYSISVRRGQAATTVRSVNEQLNRVGNDFRLGIAWDWLREQPNGFAPWRFTAVDTTPPLTAAELTAYVDASRRRTAAEQWVMLEPLEADRHATEARAADLAQRMLSAKIQQAERICATNPFDERTGLLRPDGTPGELFLPWRSVSGAVAGAEYLGAIQLPGGSSNHVFSRGDDAVMIVWNDAPTEETLYLGEALAHRDLWGRDLEVEENGRQQTIHVSKTPTIVTGLNDGIARWRIGFRFDMARLPSVFGEPHQNGYRFVNDFPVGAQGTIRLQMPDRWHVDRQLTEFKLEPGAEYYRDFLITLPFAAASGRQPVRVDVELSTDRTYLFSIYRDIEVGLGDIEIELTTRLLPSGDLEVEQRFFNNTGDEVNFICDLFAPERRRNRSQLLRVGQGNVVHYYRLEKGAELVGKSVWVRAEEQGGQRTLNGRVTVTP